MMDALTAAGIEWRGRLTDRDFLQRLYDLEKMPSFDGRFQTAGGDIHQHMTNNRDWEPDWVMTDRRFNLLYAPDAEFLRFLGMTLNPRARSDESEATRVASIYNDHLRPLGFEFVRLASSKPGQSAYVARSTAGPDVRPALAAAERAADILSNDYIRGRIASLRSSIGSKPSETISAAKETVESVCREILRRREVEVGKDAELSTLMKRTCRELRLVPAEVATREATVPIQALMTNLAGVIDSIGKIRNSFGEGHGKDSTFKELELRHAGLVIEAAAAIVEFLILTWLADGGT